MSDEEMEAERLLAKAEELIEEAEEILDEVIDLEQCAKEGRTPPKARGYRVKVNETTFVWPKDEITGEEVLEQAGLKPPKDYILRLKVHGEKPRVIALDEQVHLRRDRVEKFRAIRSGQGEGEYQGRRDAPALDQDRAFLASYGLPWEIIVDGSTWVLIHEFPLPAGYDQQRVTLAIRLEGGYPITPLDMMYVYPWVQRQNGRPINAANVPQQIGGKIYQRWSRHRTGTNPWVPGQDSLETHIYLVEEFFAQELLK